MQTRAIARNVGHPPRKVRRVTDAIKGRSVPEALAILKFLAEYAGARCLPGGRLGGGKRRKQL